MSDVVGRSKISGIDLFTGTMNVAWCWRCLYDIFTFGPLVTHILVITFLIEGQIFPVKIAKYCCVALMIDITKVGIVATS